MSFEINVLVKTTLILMCVWVLALLLRRSSAAARHAVWAVGLVSVLAFPVVSRVLPSIDLPLLPTNEFAGTGPYIQETSPGEGAIEPAGVVEENTKSAAPAPDTNQAKTVTTAGSANGATPRPSASEPPAASGWSIRRSAGSSKSRT